MFLNIILPNTPFIEIKGLNLSYQLRKMYLKTVKQNLIRLIIFSLLILGVSSFGMHKYYVGVTDINHNAEAKMLEIVIKLFTDDLENALIEAGEKKFFLGEKNELPHADDAIIAYLLNNFEIEVNGKPAQWKYEGKDASTEMVWSFLSVKDIKKVKSIAIKNTCLTDILPQQTNMVHLFANGEKTSKNLNNNRIEHNFRFD